MEENANKLNINLTPEVAEGKYSNLAIVAHTPTEFVIDFVGVMPNIPQANVKARIIMTPENMKKLMYAVQNNVANYEKQFGTITLHDKPAKGSTYPLSFGGGEA